jgi:hypothetical protein
MAHETARFSNMMVRPRPSICRVVEIAWLHFATLEHGRDQRELWRDALCEALPFLIAEQPSPRWAGRGDALVFYDPEPTQTHRIGDLLLRWAWWDESMPTGEESEIRLWRPYLDMIASSSNAELQRAWCALCVLPAWQLGALIDPQTFERFDGEASVEFPRSHRGLREGSWHGLAHATSYVLGRLTSWLGAARPETVCAEDTTQPFSERRRGAASDSRDRRRRASPSQPRWPTDHRTWSAPTHRGTSFAWAAVGSRSGTGQVAPWYRNPR